MTSDFSTMKKTLARVQREQKKHRFYAFVVHLYHFCDDGRPSITVSITKTREGDPCSFDFYEFNTAYDRELMFKKMVTFINNGKEK